jgi:hypothetical protein
MMRFMPLPGARLLMLPAGLLLAGLDFVPPHRDLAAAKPLFVPEAFFIGRTEGKGVIKGPLARRTTLTDQGEGHVLKDGTLVLDQIVHREGNAPEKRHWRIRKVAEGRYSGTISDAKGPVTAEVTGNCLHVRYRIAKGNYAAEQFVYLQPGSRVAFNRMTVKKFGITVASVEETIRKVE